MRVWKGWNEKKISYWVRDEDLMCTCNSLKPLWSDLKQTRLNSLNRNQTFCYCIIPVFLFLTGIDVLFSCLAWLSCYAICKGWWLFLVGRDGDEFVWGTLACADSACQPLNMLVGWPIRVSWNREPNKDPGTITDFFQQVTVSSWNWFCFLWAFVSMKHH
jgi:hypothetical protein